MPTSTHKRAALLSGGFFGLVAAFTMVSVAEDTELDSGPRVFPYHGILELDGRPVTASQDMVFTVENDDQSCFFEERHLGVSFDQGAYQVVIGQNSEGVDPCVFDDSENIYIRIGVRPDDNDPRNNLFVPLSGRQRIHPAPFAYWAAKTKTLNVDGDMTTGNFSGDGRATVTGDLFATNLTLSDNLEVTGNATFDGDVDINQSFTTTTINSSIIFNGDTFNGAINAQGGLTAQHENGLASATIRGVGNLSTDNGVLSALSADLDVLSTKTLTMTGSDTDFKADHLNITTSNTSGFSVSDLELGDSADDTTTFTGRVNFEYCRICLLWADNGGSQKGYACIQPSDSLPFARLLQTRGDVDNNDLSGLAFVCNDSDFSSSNVADNVSWPVNPIGD